MSRCPLLEIGTPLEWSTSAGARSTSLRPRRSFVRCGVRQDLRGQVPPARCRHDPPRQPTCRSVRRSSKLPSLLQSVPPHLCAVAVVGSNWRGTPGLSLRLCQLAWARSRHAASALLVSQSLPQPARRTCQLADIAPAGPFVSRLRPPPLVVVTAARDAQAGWLSLQERMATLSTNSSHRVVPYTHDALITDHTAAQTSSQAILGVVHAVRFGSITKKS